MVVKICTITIIVKKGKENAGRQAGRERQKKEGGKKRIRQKNRKNEVPISILFYYPD